MSYRKGSHTVYDLKVHVVWITNYRKPILRGEIAKQVRALIGQTCATLEVDILSGHVALDPIHLLVSVPPNLSVSELVQGLKGRTSRKILEELRRAFLGQT